MNNFISLLLERLGSIFCSIRLFLCEVGRFSLSKGSIVFSYVSRYSLHIILCLILSILIIILIRSFKKKPQPCLLERIILSKKLDIIDYTEGFFGLLSIKKEDFMSIFFQKEKDFHRVLVKAIMEGKNFSYFLLSKSIHLVIQIDRFVTINITPCSNRILDFFPLPILGPTGMLNNKFGDISSYREINLPMEGKFFLKDNQVFQRVDSENEFNSFSILVPLFTKKEADKLFGELLNVPLSFMWVDRKGTVLSYSEELITMFKIEAPIRRIHDFFDETRGTIFSDSADFRQQKQEFLSLISGLQEQRITLINTLDSRSLALFMKPLETRVFLCYFDLTGLSVYKPDIVQDLQKKLFSNLSDLLVLGLDSKVIFCSNEAIKSTSYEETKAIVKSIEKEENPVKEFFIGNYRFLLMKQSLGKRLDLFQNRFISSGKKIIRLFDNLAERYGTEEFSKYIRFLLFELDCSLQMVEHRFNKESFDLVSLCEQVKKQIDTVFSIRNLRIDLGKKEILVFSNKKTIETLLKIMFSIAFKHQFAQKELVFQCFDKRVTVLLKNLPKEESYDVLFDFLDNSVSPVYEVGEFVSVGFSLL